MHTGRNPAGIENQSLETNFRPKQVGDPLERWFLHRLVGEHASRVVRTAFLAVATGGPEGAEQQHGVPRQEHEMARQQHGMAGQHGTEGAGQYHGVARQEHEISKQRHGMAGQSKAPTSLEAQRLDLYEWVEHLGGCGEVR